MSFKCINIFRSSIYNALNQRRAIHTTVGLQSNIVEGTLGTHKPTPFQRKILLWTKTYKADGDIPSRVRLTQMKNAMDKFRVKVSIWMLAITFFGTGIMAMIGKRERDEGISVHKMAIQKIED